MKKNQSSLRLSLLGGVLGFVAPLLLLAFLFLGIEELNAFVAIALGIMEIIPVFIGRCLALPIENGGVAFIVYDLNLLGYTLVCLFWTAVGALAGYGISLWRKKSKLPPQAPCES